MATPASLLLIGNTVRYLAQSARAAGLDVCAVDAFGDDDLQHPDTAVQRAAAVDPQALCAAVPAAALDSGMRWVYGAGFEAAPQVLQALLRRNRHLLGNEPRVLELLNDPARLLALLAELGIAQPPTQLARPACVDGWLYKPAGRCGGVGVCRAAEHTNAASAGYYQAFTKGPLCSLLFAADGQRVQPIGFNRLLARYPAAGDFRFAAAISGFQPDPTQHARMLQVAQRLTRALGLRGVNGLDFVLHRGQPLLLELNARPTATLELYERVLPGGGLRCHIDACDGALQTPRTPAQVQGLQIVYARRDLQIGAVGWPSWVSDRPTAGSRVASHEPLCSVHASGTDSGAVAARLRQAADELHQLLTPFAMEAA